MGTLLIVAGVVVAAAGAALGYWWWRRRGRAEAAERTFSGTFTYGWEVSSFVPDGNTTEKYWVAWTPESRFMEQLKANGYDPAWTPGYAKIHARFVGLLERDGGSYGHMGQYEAQVTVLEVLEMGRAEQKDKR